MHKRFLATLFLACLLIGMATVAGASPLLQDDVIPPKIVETNPYVGEELLLTQSITLYFDQAMAQDSVATALQLSPEAGKIKTLEWQDDRTLVITPDGEWTRDAELTLHFDTAATTVDGVPLADPIDLTFQTIGFLEVSNVLPAPRQNEVAGDSLITVIFNRPVVPLVTAEEQGDLVNPITINPPIEGQGEWLNTSIFVFHPTNGIPGGRSYTVTVNAGLTDTTGAVLAEDYKWSFVTLRPEITDVEPYDDETKVSLKPQIRMSFSQPMDPDTTGQAFILNDLTTHTLVPGKITWTDDGRTLIFEPTDLLTLDTQYFVSIDTDVATSEYGAPLKEGWRSYFYTVPYPAIERTIPTDREGYASPYGGFEILFNAPIDPDTLEDKVIIEPEPWRDYDTYYYDYNESYQLFFDTEPSTDYTVTILPGIKDPYGNTINDTTIVRYTTARYDPEINLNVPGFVGLYSAYNANTRVFATHRNVSNLNMQLYNLDLSTVANFLGDDGYNYRESYVPYPEDLLRSWTVQVQSQPNQRRYELLLLSEQGGNGIQNIQCLGAPESRMMLGDLGKVAEDDPRPLRVRSLPNLQGEILMELDPGRQFNVLDGPICADGYIWWKVFIVNDSNTIGWVAEGTQQSYFIEMLERHGDVVGLDAQPEDFPPLAPGAYYLVMSAPETSGLGYDPIQHVALVASVNITLKYSANRMLAWVTDLQTGQPVADVPVQFYDRNFGELGTITTNSDGLALLEIPHLENIYQSLYASVQTSDQFGFASGEFEGGISPWQYNVPTDYEPETRAAYLYTDRPLYRPGQPVYFRGVIRDRDDVTLTIPQGMNSVPVKVYDPSSQVVFDDNLQLTPHGTFAGEFTLDEAAALGYYRIELDVSTQEYRYYGIGFNVGEYVAPEFSVTVTPSATEVVQGDTVDVLVEATYFFGGAVSDSTVAWSLLSADYSFQPEGVDGYYDFTDYNYDEGPGEYYGAYGEEIASGEGKTDAEGKFMISVPADLGKRTQSQEYTIEARVVDESDYLVAGRATVIVHQGDVYVGLRPERYIGTAGKESAVQALVLNWESDPVAGQTVDYRVVERFWSSVQEEDELGRTVWTWEVEEKDIEDGTGTVTTDENGKARITFVPQNSGTYKVYASTTDEAGNGIRSSTFLWVSGSDYVSWRQQNSDRFDLITDKQTYKVGDTAEILIASPFQGEVTALVTVERGDIIKHEVLKLETNSQVYKLPITPDFAPNVFVSVLIIKGVDENNSYAQFRMGLVQLDVDPEQLVLNVTVTPHLPPEGFVGPGDTLTYDVKTTNWEGKPVSAEVGISVTDLSVLGIAPPNSGTLMDYFYAQRGVSVRTATALTISVDRTTQTIIDTIKGGGGGGNEAGIFDIRQEFVDTPGWEPTLVTDENGEATYSLTLPDNLTVWRLDARAVTDGNDGHFLVGQTTTDVQSTKPLLVRPLTPRFLVVDDQVTLGMIVNNNTDTDQEVEVSIQGTGFTLADGVSMTQTVTIPTKGRQRINWDVTVLDVTEVDVTFFANGNDGEYTDASKPTATQGKPLPVYKYESPEIVGTAGTLTEGGTRSELVALPHRYEVTDGTLTIKVDRSLAAATTAGLDYLENYPHQCAEQTVSRFLPNVMTARALSELNLYKPDLKAHLDDEVNFGIQRLYATQHVDGGWGWFPQSESSYYVTAYALLGLTEARISGYTIDQKVINGAAGYLQQSVDNFPVSQAQDWQLDMQAFLIYSLTHAGFFQTSPASNLYDQRTRLNLDASAFLGLAMAEMNPNDPRLPNFLTDWLGQSILSATGAHWEDDPNPYTWTTDTRSTALVLKGLIALAPDNELIPQVVRWLMVARKGDAWETTQETAWSVMALTDWMVVSGELRPDYNFSVALNGSPLVEDDTATPDNVTESEVLSVQVADLLADQANRVSFNRTEGQGNLYYTAHLKAYLPVDEIEPLSRGIILDRKYYMIDPNDRQAENRPLVTGGTAGDEIEVVLSIIVPHDLYFVVIEDPIPAGSAAIDTNLLTTSVLSEGPSLDRPLSYGWGWWWWFGRTEFRDEKVVMYADYLPAGTYEYRYSLRLGLPGTFNVMPPVGYEFYFPEVYGRGAGSTFTVAPLIDSEAVEPE